MSIRTRLTLTIVVFTILPAIGLLAIIFIIARNAQSDFVKTRSLAVNTEINRQLTLRLDHYLETLNGLAASDLITRSLPILTATGGRTTTPTTTEAYRELNEILPIVAETNLFEDIILLDRQGTVLYRTEKQATGDDSRLASGIDETAFRQAASSEDDTIIILEDDEDTETHHSLFLTHSFRDGRDLQGVFMLHIPMANFQNILDSVRALGQTAESYLAIKELESTQIVTAIRKNVSDTALRSSLQDARGEAALRAANGGIGYGRVLDYGGDHVLASWGYNDQLKVGIVVKMDVSDALSIAGELRGTIIMALSSLLGFLIIVVALIVNWFVTKPLVRLAKTAEQISNGNYSVQIDQKLLYTNHEYGRLASILHHIAHRLKYEHESPAPDGQKNS